MTFIGIDPGLDGALAAVDDQNVASVFDVPIFALSKNGKARREYDAAGMAALLKREFNLSAVRIVIEAVHAMPGNGSLALFSLGQGHGIWLGIFAALGLPFDVVVPRVWKKVMLASVSKEKDVSRFRAQQLFPALSDRLNLKKHHGRAEALLLAEYRRRLG